MCCHQSEMLCLFFQNISICWGLSSSEEAERPRALDTGRSKCCLLQDGLHGSTWFTWLTSTKQNGTLGRSRCLSFANCLYSHGQQRVSVFHTTSQVAKPPVRTGSEHLLCARPCTRHWECKHEGPCPCPLVPSLPSGTFPASRILP